MPMDGAGALVQSSEEDAAVHVVTPEQAGILAWVRNLEPPQQNSIVMAGPGTGKTALVVRIDKAVVGTRGLSTSRLGVRHGRRA